jgi:hypothetical protein
MAACWSAAGRHWPPVKEAHAPHRMSRFLIILGIVLIAVGVLWPRGWAGSASAGCPATL